MQSTSSSPVDKRAILGTEWTVTLLSPTDARIPISAGPITHPFLSSCICVFFLFVYNNFSQHINAIKKRDVNTSFLNWEAISKNGPPNHVVYYGG